MKYDEYMDKECIPICDALNGLPGVATFESCCGHLQRRYAVHLYTDNPYSMAVIARAFDRRYLPTKSAWQVTIETIDAEMVPQFCIGIYSEEPFKDYETMMHDANEVADSIRYWVQPEFYEHFKFNKYNRRRGGTECPSGDAAPWAGTADRGPYPKRVGDGIHVSRGFGLMCGDGFVEELDAAILEDARGHGAEAGEDGQGQEGREP